jgi:hypothetical protein
MTSATAALDAHVVPAAATFKSVSDPKKPWLLPADVHFKQLGERRKIVGPKVKYSKSELL